MVLLFAFPALEIKVPTDFFFALIEVCYLPIHIHDLLVLVYTTKCYYLLYKMKCFDALYLRDADCSESAVSCKAVKSALVCVSCPSGRPGALQVKC